MTSRTKVAIFGSGNIGSDLMLKVIRLSDTLEMAAMGGELGGCGTGCTPSATACIPTGSARATARCTPCRGVTVIRRPVQGVGVTARVRRPT